MDAKTRAIVMLHVQPMLEAFKQAMAEEPKSPEEIETMLAYIESTNQHVDREILEAMLAELREAARASHQGSGTVQ